MELFYHNKMGKSPSWTSLNRDLSNMRMAILMTMTITFGLCLKLSRCQFNHYVGCRDVGAMIWGDVGRGVCQRWPINTRVNVISSCCACKFQNNKHCTNCMKKYNFTSKVLPIQNIITIPIRVKRLQ